MTFDTLLNDSWPLSVEFQFYLFIIFEYSFDGDKYKKKMYNRMMINFNIYYVAGAIHQTDTIKHMMERDLAARFSMRFYYSC
jgi:hypothetical protein